MDIAFHNFTSASIWESLLILLISNKVNIQQEDQVNKISNAAKNYNMYCSISKSSHPV